MSETKNKGFVVEMAVIAGVAVGWLSAVVYLLTRSVPDVIEPNVLTSHDYGVLVFIFGGLALFGIAVICESEDGIRADM